MFEGVTQRRRRAPGVIVFALTVVVLGAGVLWLKSKADHKAAAEARFQKYEAARESEEKSLTDAALPGMSIQLPGPAAVSADYQEGEAAAGAEEVTAWVKWRIGEPRSEADFGKYVRFVAGSFIGAGMQLTTGCEHPEHIQLGGHPALRCEENLISSMSSDRRVPPSVVIMTTTCDGRIVDVIVTSPLIASRMESTFHCTPTPK